MLKLSVRSPPSPIETKWEELISFYRNYPRNGTKTHSSNKTLWDGLNSMQADRKPVLSTRNFPADIIKQGEELLLVSRGTLLF